MPRAQPSGESPLCADCGKPRHFLMHDAAYCERLKVERQFGLREPKVETPQPLRIWAD